MRLSRPATHVIFDMDGVLLDTERFYTEVTQAIVGRWGKVFDWSVKGNMIGRPAIGFHVRNDLNKPDLDPRLSKMGANEIERAVGDCKARSKLHQGALAKARDL